MTLPPPLSCLGRLRPVIFSAAVVLAVHPSLQGVENVTDTHVSEEYTNSLEMTFHPVPETPVLMSIWETRVSDWQAYLQSAGKADSLVKPAFPQTELHPAVNITLAEANAFCEWLTKVEREKGVITSRQLYRLPTHHEWNSAVDPAYASQVTASASGSSLALTVRYPWGQDWPPLRQAGNYNARRIQADRDDGYEYTAPVGQFAPTPEGFYDLGGNVWEWVTDAPSVTTATAALRGGSWLYWQPESLEAGYQQNAPADTRAPTVGFRCVLDDVDKSKAYQQKRERGLTQQVSEMRDKKTSSDSEIDRVKSEIMSNRTPTDEAERARLRARPNVSQEEIDRVRRDLEKAPTPPAQQAPTGQPK